MVDSPRACEGRLTPIPTTHDDFQSSFQERGQRENIAAARLGVFVAEEIFDVAVDFCARRDINSEGGHVRLPVRGRVRTRAQEGQDGP